MLLWPLILMCQMEQAWPTDADGWRQATPSRTLQFPVDHAAHPQFRIEWWYYTGHLESAAGRHFGFELTFFRIGVMQEPATASRFAVRDLYMAHWAISDLNKQTFVHSSQLRRAGIGAAGSATDRYHVWNGQWSVTLEEDTHHLRVSEPAQTLDLRLVSQKPAVLHGRNGYSQKGTDPGNASHYYSLTRLAAAGTLQLGDEVHDVKGIAWMDHEFGSSFLEPGTVGWDWLSLHFEDGWDLMLYRLRGTDGKPKPYSSGTAVRPDGSTIALKNVDFTLTPGDQTWTSPSTDATYPISWNATVPSLDWTLTITTPLPGQELDDARSPALSYWEGAVNVDSRRNGQPVKGRGYLEMTGYAGGLLQEALR